MTVMIWTKTPPWPTNKIRYYWLRTTERTQIVRVLGNKVVGISLDGRDWWTIMGSKYFQEQLITKLHAEWAGPLVPAAG